jgi:hypothetical protein
LRETEITEVYCLYPATCNSCTQRILSCHQYIALSTNRLRIEYDEHAERTYIVKIAKIDEGPNIIASYIIVIQVFPKDCDRTKSSNLLTGILRNACEMLPKRVTRAIEEPEGSGTLLGVRESVKLTESLSDEAIK